MAFTFRPSKEATEALEKIKLDHHENTNSKALEHVLIYFSFNEKRLKTAESRIFELEYELLDIKKTVMNKEKCDKEYHKMVSNFKPG